MLTSTPSFGARNNHQTEIKKYYGDGVRNNDQTETKQNYGNWYRHSYWPDMIDVGRLRCAASSTKEALRKELQATLDEEVRIKEPLADAEAIQAEEDEKKDTPDDS